MKHVSAICTRSGKIRIPSLSMDMWDHVARVSGNLNALKAIRSLCRETRDCTSLSPPKYKNFKIHIPIRNVSSLETKYATFMFNWCSEGKKGWHLYIICVSWKEPVLYKHFPPCMWHTRHHRKFQLPQLGEIIFHPVSSSKSNNTPSIRFSVPSISRWSFTLRNSQEIISFLS